MARPRKTAKTDESLPTEDFPIQHEPGDHDGAFDNVVPFTSGGEASDQAIQQVEQRDTSSLDQFLAQYGIEFV